MTEARARLVGINHIALEVGDIDEALEFYGSLFGFELRGRWRASPTDAVGSGRLVHVVDEQTDQARSAGGELRRAVDLFMWWMNKPTRPARMPVSPCSPRSSTVSSAGTS